MANHGASGRSVETSGRTVEQAVEAALARLGSPRDEVEVQVLREASRGVLGFGAHDAIVRVTQRLSPTPVVAPAADDMLPLAEDEEIEEEEELVSDDEDEDFLYDEDEETVEEQRRGRSAVEGDELADISREVLLGILERMHVIADVLATWSEPEDEKDQPVLILDIIGDDVGLLIGRRGETLRDLQYIVRLMVSHRIQGWANNIVVDVEGYKQRRERTVRQMARRMAERVISTGNAAHMEAMNPYERRLVHLELRNMDGVRTKSSGEGERRKVGIFPT